MINDNLDSHLLALGLGIGVGTAILWAAVELFPFALLGGGAYLVYKAIAPNISKKDGIE